MTSPPAAGPDSPWKPALAVAGVGIVLVACIVVGALLGIWLDESSKRSLG